MGRAAVPEMPYMSKSTASDKTPNPGISCDPRMVRRLHELSEDIAEGKPVEQIVNRTLVAVNELFGLTGMVLRVVADDIKQCFEWATYGYPKEQAEAIITAISAGYYPKDITDKMFSEKFRVGKNSYYIPAEEWFKLATAEPWADHPSYYRHPENARTPRKSPDEWHESDSYMFSMRSNSGELLAWLAVNYSVDDRLLKQETLEAVDLFISMATLALRRERMKLGGDMSSTKAVQRTELLEDVLRIASSIVSERDVRKLSDMILTSVSSLFGFKKVTLVAHDEAEGVFKWIAFFGYPDNEVQETKTKGIPTDIILEDLKENRRIGNSAYFTRFEDCSPAQLEYFVKRPPLGQPSPPVSRAEGEFSPYDCLAFVLHDSTGRIVGVIYPSGPKDGRLPDQERLDTIEVFTSLAEVALENARLSSEREQALRLSSQRTEQLSRILDVTSGIMYVHDLPQMLDNHLKTLAQLLGMRRMLMGVKHEELGVYKIESTYGYSPKASEAIKRLEYKISVLDSVVHPGAAPAPMESSSKWRKKIGRMTYYMPAESQIVYPTDLVYYPDPELIRLPRRGKDHWHELDYTDTFIFDRNGKPIAFLEILKPREDRIPDSETIEIVEIFASLAGIAIENARMFQEHIDNRRNAELYTDILSHDIKNYDQAVLGYVDLLRIKLKGTDYVQPLDRIAEQVLNMSRLATNVRTVSRLSFSDIDLARTDLGAVLLDCSKSVTQYFPSRRIVFTSKVVSGRCFVKADELVKEMFINILTNAVKYDSHDVVNIEVSVDKVAQDDENYWTVSIADYGRGISDDVKDMVFDRFSKAPKKKGSGLGLYIVKTLANRYGGKVWFEDRVKGDYTQGTVFKVRLPAVE